MISELKKHLKSRSPEQLKKEWEEVKEFENIGLRAWEFIEMQKKAHKQVSKRILINKN